MFSKFAQDLSDCLEAWTVYAEARFGKPVEVRLTHAQLKERFNMTGPFEYETYRYTEVPPGWSEAHEQFAIGFMYARGHVLDLKPPWNSYL